MTPGRKKLIAILGQTATGKSDLAIKLSKKFNGEIISADSRQIYREMDIGTAKKDDFCGIPHYLIDIIYPNEEFSVAVYKKLAIQKIKKIQARGKIPFLVGGTGFYISAIVDNIDPPAVSPNKKLREKLNEKSAEELFSIFKKLDPRGAEFIESKNKRRLMRAIEVCRETGKPFWEQRKKKKQIFDILQIGIKVPKEKLEKRIEKRIEKMFKIGLKEEVNFLAKKYGFKIAPMRTIGYQEWQEYFDGKIDKNKVKELITLHTKQFSRRQMTWFKRNNEINWIERQKEAEKLIELFLNYPSFPSFI